MKVSITLSQDQKNMIARAAAANGLPLSLWIRTLAINAARNAGVSDPAKIAAREAMAAEVAERRAARIARQERKEAIAKAEAIEDAAWAELDRLRGTGAAPEAITAALAAAVSLQNRRKALEEQG